MRSAGRDDLYALQQAPDPYDPFDFRPAAPEILHRNCGGRISYQPGHVTDTDRYVCNGFNRIGKCGWSWRCTAVHGWSDKDIGDALYIQEKPDERVYRLELAVGKRGEDSTTHYRLRPATSDERRSFNRGTADTWKIK